MTLHHELECLDCGLAARVAGNTDQRYFGITETIWCPRCRVLADVTTEEFPPETNPEAPRTRFPLVCEDCGNPEVRMWRLTDPCPACEGRIQNHGIALIEG